MPAVTRKRRNMGEQVAIGTFRARATSARWAKIGDGGSLAAVVVFAITEPGPEQGKLIEWSGWFVKETSQERTGEALAAMGWDGQSHEGGDLGPSVRTNEVYIVVDDEVYKGKTYRRVQFVNDLDRGGKVVALSAAEQQDATARLRAIVLKKKEEKERLKNGGGASASDVSFDFGANAPEPGPGAADRKAGF
jgi:hypothetical protein